MKKAEKAKVKCRNKLLGQYYNALKSGDYNALENLILKEGLSVDHVFDDSNMPIHILASQGHIEGLRFILSLHACPNWKTKHGLTALMLGITYDQVGYIHMYIVL